MLPLGVDDKTLLWYLGITQTLEMLELAVGFFDEVLYMWVG